MNDRGIIKWQPFNSVIPSKIIINSILLEKNKIEKPILSIDQLNILNDLILESYYSQSKIKVRYFKNNNIKELSGNITSIDQNSKIIILNNQLKLHISQILQINT